jgi:hypothetical protein
MRRVRISKDRQYSEEKGGRANGITRDDTGQLKSLKK